jgi:alkylhydroperoxidase family enzyme
VTLMSGHDERWRTMAHVPLHDEPKGLIPRLAHRYTKRRFGRMVEPTAAASHHSGVLVAMGSIETAAQLGWKKLDPTLRWLAIQATGMRIGCSWCVDYGYYEGMHDGIDPAKVRAVGDWRASNLFDERERAVLEYAEVATGCPAEVSDALAARVRTHLGDAAFVELAAWVALENFRSRFNAGLGLRSQGFSDACEIPMRAAAAGAGDVPA